MNPKAKHILTQNVATVSSFQAGNGEWAADFSLRGGQQFHVRYNEDGFLYTPDVKHNKLPDLVQIFWKRYRMGFGGRGCGLDTEVQLSDSAQADKPAYERILTPTEVDEGHWVPYPDYHYVPMLVTAFEIRYAWMQQQKFAAIMAKANQNLSDVLALKKATYDLRQYE